MYRHRFIHGFHIYSYGKFIAIIRNDFWRFYIKEDGKLVYLGETLAEYAYFIG